jgi:putative membrane protein
MTVVALAAAVLAGLLHVFIFYMEAIGFMQPKIHRRFFVKDLDQAATVRIWAFNQGFYNLFLAIGTLVGVAVFHSHEAVGRALVVFGCGSMFGAGLVLVASDRRAIQAAVTQALFPAIALALIW